MSRTLHWDGCVNVRDLGGLPTEDGSVTRHGAVVRSDNVRRLTDAGWQALAEHGVRTVVDLRWAEELAEDPPREVPIDVVHVSLFGNLDQGYYDDLGERLSGLTDPADLTRESYLEFLERYRDNLVRAVTAVARAARGGVVVHCAAGKDRTGLVSALLLRLAGVGVDEIAADYGESEANLEALTVAWQTEARDDEERARRQTLYGTPREAMAGVLAELERRYGSVRAYLLAGGAAADDLDAAAARLR
jgi:protein tyrosine/serine phosphatase